MILLLVLGTALLGLTEAERTGLLYRKRAYVPLFTARPGGAFVALGGRLREVITNDSASRLELIEIPSAGSAENLESMAKYKNAISFTFVRVPDFLRRRAQYKSVRAIALLNRDVVQVVASKDSRVRRIEQLGELDDRGACKYRVYVGMTGSGTLETATELMQARYPRCFAGWRAASEKLDYEGAAVELKNKTLDAAIFSTGLGAPAIDSLFLRSAGKDGDFMLVPLDEIERSTLVRRGYEDAVAEVYGTELRTVTARILIATNEGTDDWIVRELVDALERHRREVDEYLTKLHKGDSSPLITDPAKLKELIQDVPLHEARSSEASLASQSGRIGLVAVALLFALQLGLLLPLTKNRVADADPVKRVREHRIFVSYGAADRKYVERVLVPHLEKHGISVWWSDLIQVGAHFQDAIADAIDKAVWVIVVLSPDTKNSRWVKFEIEAAVGNGKALPLIVRHPCSPRDTHIGFGCIQCIDLTQNSERELERLVERLRQAPAGTDARIVGAAKEDHSLAPS